MSGKIVASMIPYDLFYRIRIILRAKGITMSEALREALIVYCIIVETRK